MKKVNDILTHLKDNSSFEKIDTFLEIKRFINILPLKLKSGIKFAYIKNNTLIFMLKHPQFKAEFKYSNNISDLKALLKMSNLRNIQNFEFYVSNSIDKVQESDEINDIKYKERSLGIFENSIKDEKLFLKFENIRKIIKELRD